MAGNRNQAIQQERTWLGIAISLVLAGAAMIAGAAASRFGDPFLYVGAVFCGLAVWVLVGVFAPPKLLPKLPSERRAESVQRQVSAFLVEGQRLERRRIKNEEGRRP
jgi:hypothetical protein